MARYFNPNRRCATPVHHFHGPNSYNQCRLPAANVCSNSSPMSAGEFTSKQQTLGVTGGVTSASGLARELPGSTIRRDRDGSVTISFDAVADRYRIGYSFDGGFSLGGSFTRTYGRDGCGKWWFGTGSQAPGRYDVKTEHLGNGKFRFTVTLDKELTRARLDIADKIILIDPRTLGRERSDKTKVRQQTDPQIVEPDATEPTPPDVVLAASDVAPINLEDARRGFSNPLIEPNAARVAQVATSIDPPQIAVPDVDHRVAPVASVATSATKLLDPNVMLEGSAVTPTVNRRQASDPRVVQVAQIEVPTASQVQSGQSALTPTETDLTRLATAPPEVIPLVLEVAATDPTLITLEPGARRTQAEMVPSDRLLTSGTLSRRSADEFVPPPPPAVPPLEPDPTPDELEAGPLEPELDAAQQEQPETPQQRAERLALKQLEERLKDLDKLRELFNAALEEKKENPFGIVKEFIPGSKAYMNSLERQRSIAQLRDQLGEQTIERIAFPVNLSNQIDRAPLEQQVDFLDAVRSYYLRQQRILQNRLADEASLR